MKQEAKAVVHVATKESEINMAECETVVGTDHLWKNIIPKKDIFSLNSNGPRTVAMFAKLPMNLHVIPLNRLGAS